MKTLKLLATLFVFSLVFESHVKAPAPSATVYIAEKGSVYHAYKTCRGLAKANSRILAVSEKDAINKYGRRKCKYCY